MTSSGGRARSASLAVGSSTPSTARYFGELTPVLTIPGAIIAGALSSYGVAFGSLTLNLNDVAVKGHLPASETTRVTKVFAEAPADAVRILTFHHNVLRGGISRRMGLANWRAAYRRLLATGADVILCGHDHHEGAGQIEGALAVSTAGPTASAPGAAARRSSISSGSTTGRSTSGTTAGRPPAGSSSPPT